VLLRAYLVLGLSEAVVSLGAYLLLLDRGGRQASTMTFALIVAGQMGALLACRTAGADHTPGRGLQHGTVATPMAGLATAGAAGSAAGRHPAQMEPAVLAAPSNRLGDALTTQLTFEQGKQIIRIAILVGQAGVEGLEALPAHCAAHLVDRFAFSDQQSQRFAIQGIVGLEFTDGESCCIRTHLIIPGACDALLAWLDSI